MGGPRACGRPTGGQALRGVLVGLALVAVAGAPAAAAATRAPVYRSPGYKAKRIPGGFVAAKPPPPVVLQPSGHDPRVFVDGAGSAHIAFADPNGTGADVIRTCRLPRGAKGCATGAALSPDEPGPGNDPQTNQDFEWLVEMGIPEKGHDLNAAMNRMLKRAQGELVVIVQDYITIPHFALNELWTLHEAEPIAFVTFPMGKLQDDGDIKYDWRAGGEYRRIAGFDFHSPWNQEHN